MNRKLLFFDIDGTLIDSAQRLPESAAAALLRVIENGHIPALCTGRSYSQLPPSLLAFHFPGIVAASGCHVRAGDKILMQKTMRPEQLKRVTDYIIARGGYFFCQTPDTVIMLKDHGRRMKQRLMEEESMSAEQAEQIFASQLLVDDLSAYAEKIEKLLYFDLHIPTSEIQKGVGDDIEITTNSYETAPEGSGELTMAGINKAYGMKVLMDYYQIAREDTIGFGDGGNDMEMIRYAGFGVAMGNASAELKEIADMVTDPLKEDGLAHALEKLELC